MNLESLEDRALPSTVTWINPGSGNWDVPANWSTGSLPGPADDVVINTVAAATITVHSGDSIAIQSLNSAASDPFTMTGGQFFFTANSQIGGGMSLSGGTFKAAGNLAVSGTYTQTGGVLTGAGSVVVSGPTNWIGGTMSGSGTTQANGGLQLGAGDNQAHNQTLSARSVINKGNGTFFAGDALDQNNGAVFTNASGASLDLQAGITWSGSDQSDPLVNVGTLTVDALGDTATFNGYLVNRGSIAVNAGTLWLHGGGSSTGTFAVAQGATLLFPGFASAFSFSSTGALTGAGTVELDGDAYATFGPGTTFDVTGTTLISGGELVLDNGASTTGVLNLTEGELSGSASLTVTGLTNWTGGTMTGSGSTDAKSGLNLGSSGATGATGVSLAGRSLINEGTANWYALNSLQQSDSSVFTNAAGATMNLVGAPDWEGGSDDSTTSFINLGTFTFAGVTDQTLAKVYFDNEGSIQVSSGTFNFADSGIIKGSISVASGATLAMGGNFNYEAYTFTSTSSLTGAGAVDFVSGVSATFDSGSTYNIATSTLIDSGGNDNATILFAAGSNVPSLGVLNINSGVVNFSTGATITVPSLNQTGGVLTGPDAVVVTGATSWTGGAMSGTGTTTAVGGLTLGAADGSAHQESLEVRKFINQAAAVWTGTGNLYIDTGGVFVNQVGATFDEEGPLPIFTNVGVGQEPSGTFENDGTFTISSGATASMEPFFFNSGLVEIASGTWELTGNGSSTGTIQVDNGTTFQLNQYYAAGTITGPGNVQQIQGSNAAPASFTGGDIPVKPAGPSFFEVSTDTTVGTLNMTGGFLIVDATLTVTGAMNWSGGYIVGPGKIIAEGGLTLGQAAGDQQFWYGTTIVNTGAATIFGQAEIGMNYGAVFVNQPGATIAIQGGGSGFNTDGTVSLVNQGSITVAAGAGTTYSISFVAITNSGSISVTSGTLDLESAGSTSGSFGVAAGSTIDFGHSFWDFTSGSKVSGAGTLDFPFDYWPISFESGSTFDVSGITSLDSQAPLAFFAGAVIQDMGALSLLSGGVMFGTGTAVPVDSLIANGGTLTGSDTVDVAGATTWLQGEMSGTGLTNAQGGLTIGAATNDHGKQLFERTFINSGVGSVIGTQTFEEDSGASFVNAQGAKLNVAAQITWLDAGDNTSTFENDGAMTIAPGAKTFTFNSSPGRPAFLNNVGSIEVATGTLEMIVDGVSKGALTVDAGAALEFDDNANFEIASGPGVTGAGSVLLNAGQTVFDPGAVFTVTGATSIDGGATFNNSPVMGALNLLNGGELSGTGTVTINGTTTWTGGTMSGSGTTLPVGGLLIGQAGDSGDVETLSGRTINNSATAAWAGGGSFNQNLGGVFVNQSGATFSIANDLKWNSDPSALFLNAGAFTKTGIAATTTFQSALNNSNSVLVQKGTLSLQGGGVFGGTYTIASGANLTIGSDVINPGTPTFPVIFTDGNWAGTFSGTATDQSGTGIASVGVSLFDGTHYFNGTAFTSTTPIFNPAVLNGLNWSYAVPISIFASDKTYTVQSQALDNSSGVEPSTTTQLLLTQAAPQVTSIAPVAGPVTGGTKVTITGLYLSGAFAVDFGSDHPGTIVSSTPTSVVAMAPAGTAGNVDITVTTDQGVSSIVPTDQFTYVALPTSSVDSLAAVTTTLKFTVSWSGQGAANSGGIASYDIYSSDNNGPFTLWLSDTTQTSAQFTGQNGHSYGFYSIATDNVGGVQPTPASAQTTTTVNAPPPISSVKALPTFSKPSFTVSWSGTDAGGPGIASYDIYVSDNGGSFTKFLTGTTDTSATFDGQAGHTYGFFSVATDSEGSSESLPTKAQASTQAMLDTPNKQYTDAVYSDLLGRSPDLSGLNYWSGQLDQGSARALLINLIDHSAEYFSTIIKPAYQQFLGRPADSSGVSFWTNQMINGLTDEQLEAGFIGSAEFYTHSGGTDASWVDAMYESLLGRHADPSGEAFWTQQLADGASRDSVAFGFAASLEREGQHVQADYLAFLGRSAGSSEIAFWVGQFSQGVTNEDIITGFISSTEYYDQHTS